MVAHGFVLVISCLQNQQTVKAKERIPPAHPGAKYTFYYFIMKVVHH
jgi:hypothetical protein